ncbi:MAG: hypothetical protein BWY76_02090 [bacterium ADurb.Bin429]|nr:MAG: hypothetical protein BWY76_02090 [bacterium ADurb.Bin429]
MYVDRGLNDRWVRPRAVRKTGHNRWTIALRETLGLAWATEIVAYPFPAGSGLGLRVTCRGETVPWQYADGKLHLLVLALASGEALEFDVTLDDTAQSPSETPGIAIREIDGAVLISNGLLSLKLPSSALLEPGIPVPGPLQGVCLGDSPWMGRSRLESPLVFRSVTTRLVEAGALWTSVEVQYDADEGHYAIRFLLRPNATHCEVREESTLPVRLWPAPRPYREIGSIGSSHWSQALEDIAKPCLRPCPTSNVILDFADDFSPDRLITHSTASWEIVDLPLGAPSLKTYTAMRPALPSIDGGWFGVYDTRGDAIFGVVPLDIAHWGIPDDVIHPAHRTVGAHAEVFFIDVPGEGGHFRFPIENVARRWLLAVASRHESLGERGPLDGTPIRREPDFHFPLWALHTERGDLRLDKVKDWVTDWPDAGDAHPHLLCRTEDFPAIHEKVLATPELCQAYEATRELRSSDRFILEGEPVGLAPIEAATHVKALLEAILKQGYTSPHYCIALVRTSGQHGDRHKGLSQILVDLKTPGVTIRPVINLAGRHEWNEVTFTDAIIPRECLIGNEGDGWKQVTSELAFERAGPERFLQNFHVLGELVRVLGRHPSKRVAAIVGRLVARLWTLRQMAVALAGMLQDGKSPVIEAALVKDLGTIYQQDMPEIARVLAESDATDEDVLADFLDIAQYSTMIAPSFTIQGGTTQVLRGMVARGLGLR